VQDDVAASVLATAAAASDPADSVPAGLAAYLDACLEPDFRRIVVLDSVTVLQRGAWEGDGEHRELAMQRQVLTPLVDAYLPGLSTDALTHIALGGLYNAALHIARSPQPEAARAEADTVVKTLISALRSGAASPHAHPPPVPG
jgi:hypothetical protein